MFAELAKAWVNNGAANSPQNSAAVETPPVDTAVWLLRKVEATGFGGLNGAAHIKPLVVEFTSGPTCIYGGNGSGKTSLVSAILWALTGQRLSDMGGPTEAANTPQPIFDTANPIKQIRTWPPVATYPDNIGSAAVEPKTRVTLTFQKQDSATEASITRHWQADVPGFTIEHWDKSLEPMRNCLDVAVEMPLRIAHLRLGQNDRLNDAVASLTGLDLISSVGELVSWLGRKNAPFLSNPRKAEHAAQARSIEEQFTRAIEHVPTLKVEIVSFRSLTDWLSRANEHTTGLKKIADELTRAAAKDLASLKDYVGLSIDLDTPGGQRSVANAVAAAVNAYTSSLLNDSFAEKCPLLAKLGKLSKNSQQIIEKIDAAIIEANAKLARVIGLHRRRLHDSKLILKAVAAETHQAKHGNEPIDECVLCEQLFNTEELGSRLN